MGECTEITGFCDDPSTKIICGCFCCVIACVLLSLGAFYTSDGSSLINYGEGLNDKGTNEMCLITNVISQGVCRNNKGWAISDKNYYEAISFEKCANKTLPIHTVRCQDESGVDSGDMNFQQMNQTYHCFVYNSCLTFRFDSGDSKIKTGNLELIGGILMLVFGVLFCAMFIPLCYFGVSAANAYANETNNQTNVSNEMNVMVDNEQINNGMKSMNTIENEDSENP
eukprot:397090_1